MKKKFASQILPRSWLMPKGWLLRSVRVKSGIELKCSIGVMSRRCIPRHCWRTKLAVNPAMTTISVLHNTQCSVRFVCACVRAGTASPTVGTAGLSWCSAVVSGAGIVKRVDGGVTTPLPRGPSNDVQDHEEEDPNHVHEVPVQRGDFQVSVVVRCETSGHRHEEGNKQ